MSDLEKDLLSLQASDFDDTPEDDLGLFKRAEARNKASKRRKKNRLFKEMDSVLYDGFNGDDDMDFVLSMKRRKKNKVKADGDLFDTDDDSSAKKKFKNVEAKFKPEIANLQRILRDNEETAKAIKTVLEPLLTSKARGSSKLLADLLIALNSANNNRLSVVKELSSVKKAIYDLKIKLQKDEHDDLGMPSDQFGAKLLDELFKSGRSTVVDRANQYNQDINPYVTDQQPDMSTEDYEDFISQRLATESNDYRSPDGTKMIEYENRHPEICIEKSFSTGEFRAVAIDDNGVTLDDYPVPSNDQLGKVIFNNDSNTCTDMAGRVYKVIEVG